jgi:hypothetical protein
MTRIKLQHNANLISYYTQRKHFSFLIHIRNDAQAVTYFSIHSLQISTQCLLLNPLNVQTELAPVTASRCSVSASKQESIVKLPFMYLLIIIMPLHNNTFSLALVYHREKRINPKNFQVRKFLSSLPP